ncbi:S-phase kinase-associated protein 2 isoform X2 [Prorops nasuta]|uniref:S-phase kinase-associated protein 2 isoform X2 n=1 Tax=Prorops nasuta TaxID=863751 RepID=UPI0034CFE965
MSNNSPQSPWWNCNSKRIRLEDGCNNNLNSTLNSASKNNTKWTCAGDTSLVEPEILEDMGVSILVDVEASCESLKPSPCEEVKFSPISLENRQNQPDENNDINKQDSVYRSSFETTSIDRLEQDLYDLESSVNYGNESGYTSRVEPESLPEDLESSNEDSSNNPLNKDSADKFCIFRRKKKPSVEGEDKFSKLSDEMILMILKWLPKRCLVRSMLVCKRWCQIARDEALWSRLDLGGRVLNEGTLGHILPRGVQILRLAQAEIADPVFLRPQLGIDVFSDNYISKLQYLDLSMAVISSEGLATLLSKCRLLKKLSLEKCTLNQYSCKAISENQDLEVLNLSMCEGININCVKDLIQLKKLSALNAAWCSLDAASVKILCKSLPTTITQLNLAGGRKTMTDENLEYVVKRCPDIEELDLSDCTMLTLKKPHVLANLIKLEHLSLSRCYSIPPATFLRLCHMPSLRYLDIFGIMNEPFLKTFRASSGETEINKFLYSSIARPTVGVRRTSIWGLRVRD